MFLFGFAISGCVGDDPIGARSNGITQFFLDLVRQTITGHYHYPGVAGENIDLNEKQSIPVPLCSTSAVTPMKNVL